MTSTEVSTRIIEVLENAYDAPSDWQEVQGWVAELHSIADQANRIKRELLRFLHEAQPEYEMANELGSFRKTTGKRANNWDHPLIASALAARAADEWDDEPPAAFAQKVVDKILKAAGIGYWRKGALKSEGLSPDRYYDETEDPNGPSVIFSPAKAS